MSGNFLYDEDEKDVAEKCGCEIRCCGFCRTKRLVINSLSCCNNPKVLLVFLSATSFIQGFIVSGLVNVGITTIEKRFSLRSYETGLISTSYDIGVVPCLIIVTYFGGKSHKALWVGWGVFIMGCASIVYSLPHFIAAPYDYTGGEGTNLCYNVTTEICPGENLRSYSIFIEFAYYEASLAVRGKSNRCSYHDILTPGTKSRGFFIAGQILHGVGASPIYTLGITYMDENVSQRLSSTYHGIFFAFSIFGPGLGYIVGGAFLSLYTNITESVPFTENSYLWVGAWWIGFLLAGSLAILLSFNLIMFPHQFPNTEKHRQDREKEMNKEKMAESIRGDENFGKSVKDLPKSIWILIRNKALMFLTMAAVMENAFVGGTATFGPKILESVFSKSASDAAFTFGLLALLGGALGNLSAGFIVSRFQLTVVQMLRMNLVSTVIALFSIFVFMFMCPNRDFAGASEGSLSFTCNSGCGCSQELYDPVCGSNNVTYFSPCHAGCSSSETGDYQDCACVNATSETGFSTPGLCDTEFCPNYEIVLVILFILVLFTFFNTIPNLQTSLRSVPFSQRSLALGFQWLLIRVVGSIPAVLIYGAVLDLACLVWEQECDERGSCKLYDSQKINYYIFACCFTYKSFAVIFSTVACLVYKPIGEETVWIDVKENDTRNDASNQAQKNYAFEEDEKNNNFTNDTPL